MSDEHHTLRLSGLDISEVATESARTFAVLLFGAALGMRLLAKQLIARACPDYGVLASDGCTAAVGLANQWIIGAAVAGFALFVLGIGVPWYLGGSR